MKVPSDNNNTDAEKASSKKMGNLEKTLFLCKGAKVILKKAINNQKGLYNNAWGTVLDIIYPIDQKPGEGIPTYIIVEFPSFTGNNFLGEKYF